MSISSSISSGGVRSGNPGVVNDIGMTLAGVIAFVASFFPWYGWSIDGKYVLNYNAWSGGFFSVVPVLLCVLAGAAAAARVFAGARLPVLGPAGPGFLLMVVPASAVLLVGMRWVTAPDAQQPAVQAFYEQSVRYGLLVTLFAALVQLAFAALAFQASGENLPGRAKPPPPVAAAPYGQPYGPQPMPGVGPYAGSPYGPPHPGSPAGTPGYAQPAGHNQSGGAQPESGGRAEGALPAGQRSVWAGPPRSGEPDPTPAPADEPPTRADSTEEQPAAPGETERAEPPALPPPS